MAENNPLRQMKLLADIARQLASSTDLQLLMEETVRRLFQDCGFDLISIFLVEGERLILRAADGASSHLLQPGTSVLLGQGIVGWVAQSGQTYFTDHAQSDKRFVPLTRLNTDAELAIPLRLADKVVGVLDIQNEQAHSFDSAEISTLETLADLLAAALQSGQLFAELNTRERLAGTLQRVEAAVNASLDMPTVLNTICAETRAAFDADTVGVWLMEDKADTLRLAVVHSPTPQTLLGQRLALTDETSITARAVRERRPIFLGDLQSTSNGAALLKTLTGAQSLLAVPIIKEGQPLGALAIVDSRNPRRFGEADVAAATLLGAHLAAAISNARLFAETERRAELLNLLYEVSQQGIGSLDETQILQRTVTALVNQFNFAEAAIMAPAGEDELELVAFAQLEQMAVMMDYREKKGEGIIGRVAETCTAYLANDLSSDPYFKPAGHTAGSALGLPILREGQLLGVLYVESASSNAFSPADVLTLETLVNHIVIALENARHYAEANHRLREMMALQSVSQAVTSSLELSRIFETVVRLLHIAFGYLYVAIGQLENDIVRMRAQLGYPADALQDIPITTGITGRAIRTGQTQFIRDVTTDPDFIRVMPDVQSEICIPLLKEQTALGALDVSSTSNRPLTETDVDLLTLFAGQVTVAIDHAQLYKDSQRRAEMMAALHANSLDMAIMQDLPTLLHTIVERAAKLLQAPSGGLYLCDPERREARCLVSYNTLRDFAGTVLKYGEGAAGQVAATGKPLIIDDYRAWPGRAAVYEKAQPFISVLSVPMIWKDQVIGVIHAEHHIKANFFTQDDLNLLTLFSNQAAIAVENARLLAETNRAAEEQRLLFNATRDFTAGLAEDEVLRAIARHMFNVIHAAECNIIRWDRPNDRLISLADYNGQEFYIAGAPDTDENLANYPATRHVLESRQPLVVYADDPQGDLAEHALMKRFGYSGLLMVPLLTGEQTFGVIELFRRPSQPAFSVSDVQLAQSLAAQAAVALENARLHATVKQQVRDLDALLTANTALLSTLDLDPLLHNILTAAISTIHAAEKGTILLIDPPSGQLQIRAVYGYSDPRVKNLAFAGNGGYSAQAVREKRPLLISDARADSSTRYEGDIPEVRGIHSAIVAPLILEEALLGVIALDSTRRSAFTQADLNLLVAFASTAAASINHARLHAEVQTRAATDGPTGLANRRAFDHALGIEIHRAERFGYTLSLLVLDIDSFKLYNDTYGHPAGDERIKAIAGLLTHNLREHDIAARYGGEEFALILPHTGKAGALVLAERIRAAAEGQAPEPPPANQPASGYTLSIGVAAFPEDGLTPDAILLAADHAELASKRAGKNRVSAALPLAGA